MGKRRSASDGAGGLGIGLRGECQLIAERVNAPSTKELDMATQSNTGIAGISTGGILVVVGIVIAIFWSWILGLIVALVGLLAFGGFARGRWY